MEMEVKRGRFRMSVLEDSAQVSDRSSTPAHVQNHNKLITTLPKKLDFNAQTLLIHIPDSNIVSAQIRFTSGTRRIHMV